MWYSPESRRRAAAAQGPDTMDLFVAIMAERQRLYEEEWRAIRRAEERAALRALAPAAPAPAPRAPGGGSAASGHNHSEAAGAPAREASSASSTGWRLPWRSARSQESAEHPQRQRSQYTAGEGNVGEAPLAAQEDAGGSTGRLARAMRRMNPRNWLPSRPRSAPRRLWPSRPAPVAPAPDDSSDDEGGEDQRPR